MSLVRSFNSLVSLASPSLRVKSHQETKCREVVLAKKTKKTVRRAWSKDDLKLLKSLAKQKAGVTRIAKALKRTTGATMVKASLLGVSLDTRG